MDPTNRIVMLLCATCAFFPYATSCGGSSSAPGVENLAYLSGELAVTGAPLADLDDPASVGELDSDKWALRVIDPTESVDSIEITNLDSTFGTVAVEPLDSSLLHIELLPAVDLSGGVAEATPLSLNIPIPLSEGVETTINTEIELVDPRVTSTSRAATQSEGYRVRLRYTISGPRQVSDAIEIDWNRHQLRRDVNGNGSFDDDPVYQDSDRNGISDNRQQGIMDNQMHGSMVEAAGLIEHVDTQLRRVTVDGHEFLVDETTLITDDGGRLLALADLTVGQHAVVDGRRGRFGSLYAETIELGAGQ